MEVFQISFPNVHAGLSNHDHFNGNKLDVANSFGGQEGLVCRFFQYGGRAAGIWMILMAVASRKCSRRRFRRNRAVLFAQVNSRQAVDRHSAYASKGEQIQSCKDEADASPNATEVPLTIENVEMVLDEVRPYLQNDGGDCKVVSIDKRPNTQENSGFVVRVELQGACSTCSASAITLKMGIEKTLMSRFPEISEVVAVMPQQEAISQVGVEELLDGIRPFLKGTGGTIGLKTIPVESDLRIVLKMTGPPRKSTALRLEVTNRIKRKFPQVHEVLIEDE